jgi:hypothetical protein
MFIIIYTEGGLIFWQRFVEAVQEEPSASLGPILVSLAKDYPHEFYKPLFQCAKSSNRSNVSNQLRILTAIARVYTDFWTDNVQKMLIALMGVPGAAFSTETRKQGALEAPKWGVARLGQCVLFLELIALLRRLRRSKKDDSTVSLSRVLVEKI